MNSTASIIKLLYNSLLKCGDPALLSLLEQLPHLIYMIIAMRPNMLYIHKCNTCSRLHCHTYLCTLFQLHCCFIELYWLCSCLVFMGLPLVSSKLSIFIPLRYVSNCTAKYVLSELMPHICCAGISHISERLWHVAVFKLQSYWNNACSIYFSGMYARVLKWGFM